MTLAIGTAVKPGAQGQLVPQFMNFRAQQQAQVAKVMGLPDAENTASTTTTDADSDVINLADLGFTFDEGLTYHAVAKLYGTSGAGEVYYSERHCLIVGGSTPVVVNGADEILVDTSGERIPPQGVEIIATLAPEALSPLFKVTSDEVIVQIDGDTSNPANWVCQVFVDHPVPLTVPA